MAVWSASRAIQFKRILQCALVVVTVLNLTPCWKICGGVDVYLCRCLTWPASRLCGFNIGKGIQLCVKDVSCPSELVVPLWICYYPVSCLIPHHLSACFINDLTYNYLLLLLYIKYIINTLRAGDTDLRF